MTIAAGGLITAGIGGFALRKPAVAPPGTTTSVATLASSSTGSLASLLPDYQEFLSWLRSASASIEDRSLSISMESEFAPIALQLRSADFLQNSGVNDIYNLQSYAQQLTTISLMASTQSPSYDAFSIDNQNIGAFKDAVVSPTILAETYPDLTYPGLDVGGFSAYPWDNVALYPPALSGDSGLSSQVGMYPLDMPLLVLYCRSDVYSKLELSLPTTWDEYYDDVVTISKSGLMPYGVANMASGSVSVVYEFMVHLASFGGQLWEVDGDTLSPTLDTDQALAALENYVRFKPYSDPGSVAYTWDNVFDDLSRGIAATGINWHDYYAWINQPSRSQVVGRMAVAQNPAGPSGSFSTFGGSGVGVSAYSKKPEAAWLWLQWATAKGTQETLLLDEYHVYPSREDVFQVPDVADEISGAPGPYAANAVAQQVWASNGVTALIGFPMWFDVLNVLEGQLSQAWAGKVTPSQALQNAQQGVEALGALTF